MIEKLLQFDRTHIWHPYASLKTPPPVRLAASASGVYITLADGTRLIDAVSSWWCVAHGHNHPAITEAIRRQSEKLSHVMFGGFTHEPAIELAQELIKLTPPGLNRVFFADSGSISVEVAAKMAVQYQNALGHPERSRFIALKGGYHGDTSLAMALSDPDGMHVLFRNIMTHHFFAEKPAVHFGETWREEETLESLRRVVREHAGEIAAIICEPILQAANAMNFYHPQYLREMRKLCDEYGILLIFDEIAAGFYRTGPRWAQQHAGVTPDIMTVGKAITGGHLTLAATVASEHVAQVISDGTPSAFMHGPTYMGNPLACAAGVASLKLFAQSDYAAKVAAIEAQLKEQLAPVATLPNVRDVRVIGACGVIETARLPAQADIDRIIDQYGVWLRPFCNFIYTMPPLITDRAQLEQICAAMRALAACPPGPECDNDFHE
jgi:adenosylmethionine---8-amino-7-oxononanoate aminotransferase